MTDQRAARGHRSPALLAAVIVLLVVFLTAILPTTLPPSELARTGGLGVSPAAADPLPVDPEGPQPDTEFLRLSISDVTPSIVTNQAANEVTVLGTVTNSGTQPVTDIDLRVQRTAPLSSGSEGRTALSLPESSFDTTTPFQRQPHHLAPGESADFSLTVPLSTAAGLDITRRGVYPLLVNANGRVASAPVAHLDDARVLLPVTSVPGEHAGRTDSEDSDAESGAGSGADPDANLDAPTTAPPPTPRPTTILWPLADNPHVVPGLSGIDSLVLRDDSLASSLTDSGPLGALLREGQRLREGPLGDALCLAIDPDLVATVAAMTDGYSVANSADASPEDQTAHTHPGAGTDAATQWLGRLRRLAATTCVIATPWGGSSLEPGSHPASTDALLSESRTTVASILGLDPTNLSPLVVPATGTTTRPTIDAAAPSTGPTGVQPSAPGKPAEGGTPSRDAAPFLLPATAVVPTEDTDPALLTTTPQGNRAFTSAVHEVTLAGSAQRIMLSDPWVAAALAATGERPVSAAWLARDTNYRADADTPAARVQDAIGTLTFAAFAGTGSAAAGSTGAGEPSGDDSKVDAVATAADAPLIVQPPSRWTVSATDATHFADALESLSEEGYLRAQSLTDTLAASAGTRNGVAPGAPSVKDAATAMPLAELSPPTDTLTSLNPRPKGAPAGSGSPGEPATTTPSSTAPTGTEVPALAADTRVRDWPRLTDLSDALENNPDDNLTVTGYLGPLRHDIFRADSLYGLTAPQGTEPRHQRTDPYHRTTAQSFDALYSAVSVISPGGVFTLASGGSPMVLVAQNELPLPIRAQISVDEGNSHHLSLGEVPLQTLPPRGSVSVQVPVTTEETSQAMPGGVDVSVGIFTPNGRALSTPVPVRIQSSSYGTSVVVITGLAFALLVILSARKLIRRSRGGRAEHAH